MTASPQWKGRILEGWNPEEAEHWGSQIAQRTLAIMTFSLILGLAIWFLPNATAPRLNDLDPEFFRTQFYWLISMPDPLCAALCMVYTFLPATIGARKTVYWSSLFYTLPMIGWFFVVQSPNTSFALLLLLSFARGIGAMTFSGYTPSAGLFFPKRLQGITLSLQGGLGNLDISVIQLSTPFLMSIGLFGVVQIVSKATVNPPVVVNAIIFFIPRSLLVTFLALLLLKDVPIKTNVREQLDISSSPNTWYMTVLYTMTFGLSPDFGAQTALIINNNFGKPPPLAESFNPDTPPVGLSYAPLGTFIGAVLRFAWGPLCDKFGDVIWTFISAIGMALTFSRCGWVLMTTGDPPDFTPFLVDMPVMFSFVGVGNALIFKQTLIIVPKCQAEGTQGFTGAAAALGPFLVDVALTLMPVHVFYFVAASYCVLCIVLCWMHYAHPSAPFPG